jgi:glycosyltransferase involved in cell wall biosynthesis
MYNTGHYARFAIESALKQSQKSIEVIVYDDGSTDNSLETITNLFHNEKNVRIISGKVHKNITNARNQLIKYARGEFIGFLDSDDVLLPECLEFCIKKFRGNASTGLVSTDFEYIDNKGNKVSIEHTDASFNKNHLLFTNLVTPFMIFRARDWSRSRKFNAYEVNNMMFGDNWDLAIKIAEIVNIEKVNKILCQSRIHDHSLVTTVDKDLRLNQIKKMITLHLDHFKIARKIAFIEEKNKLIKVGYL